MRGLRTDTTTNRWMSLFTAKQLRITGARMGGGLTTYARSLRKPAASQRCFTEVDFFTADRRTFSRCSPSAGPETRRLLTTWRFRNPKNDFYITTTSRRFLRERRDGLARRIAA